MPGASSRLLLLLVVLLRRQGLRVSVAQTTKVHTEGFGEGPEGPRGP